jgi:hypothetical protein
MVLLTDDMKSKQRLAAGFSVGFNSLLNNKLRNDRGYNIQYTRFNMQQKPRVWGLCYCGVREEERTK